MARGRGKKKVRSEYGAVGQPQDVPIGITLLQMPPEVLENIVEHLKSQQALRRLSHSCKTLRPLALTVLWRERVLCIYAARDLQELAGLTNVARTAPYAIRSVKIVLVMSDKPDRSSLETWLSSWTTAVKDLSALENLVVLARLPIRKQRSGIEWCWKLALTALAAPTSLARAFGSGKQCKKLLQVAGKSNDVDVYSVRDLWATLSRDDTLDLEFPFNIPGVESHEGQVSTVTLTLQAFSRRATSEGVSQEEPAASEAWASPVAQPNATTRGPSTLGEIGFHSIKSGGRPYVQVERRTTFTANFLRWTAHVLRLVDVDADALKMIGGITSLPVVEELVLRAATLDVGDLLLRLRAPKLQKIELCGMNDLVNRFAIDTLAHNSPLLRHCEMRWGITGDGLSDVEQAIIDLQRQFHHLKIALDLELNIIPPDMEALMNIESGADDSADLSNTTFRASCLHGLRLEDTFLVHRLPGRPFFSRMKNLKYIDLRIGRKAFMASHDLAPLRQFWRKTSLPSLEQLSVCLAVEARFVDSHARQLVSWPAVLPDIARMDVQVPALHLISKETKRSLQRACERRGIDLLIKVND